MSLKQTTKITIIILASALLIQQLLWTGIVREGYIFYQVSYIAERGALLFFLIAIYRKQT